MRGLSMISLVWSAGCALPGSSDPGEPPAAAPEARHVAVRVGFRAAGSSSAAPASWRHLPLESSLDTAPEGARRDLERLLDALRLARSSGEEPPRQLPEPSVVRSYEIALGGGGSGYLTIEEGGLPGPVSAAAAIGGAEARARVEAPALIDHLRRESLLELRASMSPPRRPLEWSHAALAGFLGSLPPGAPDEKAIRDELLSALLANPGPSPLAEALIEHAASFRREETEPLIAHDALAPRLLALTVKAVRGDAAALGEILTISLEHYGAGSLFDRALRTLFPRSSNPGLHARHPAGGPVKASFVEAVRAGVRGASFDEGAGWALER